MEAQSARAEDSFTQITRQDGPGAQGNSSCMDKAGRGPAAGRPGFPPLSGRGFLGGKEDTRKIPVPANRYMPLKENGCRDLLLL